MFESIRRAILNLTPEKTHAWTLAFYPALVIIAVGYLLVSKTPITPEIVGLFVGLLTAGSLRAAIKPNGPKNGDKNDQSGSSDNSTDSIYRGRDQELGKGYWRRPDDSDRRNDIRNWLHWNPVLRLS